jgi:histidine triad (HIT) family protein
MDCIFCKIVAGEVPCHKIYEDDRVIAFLDIMPVSQGHLLIIPKEHHQTLATVPDGCLSTVLDLAKRLWGAVEQAFQPQGFNILQNNGSQAGQVIPHVHFHLIPRYNGDRVFIRLHQERAPAAELEATRRAIMERLGA